MLQDLTIKNFALIDHLELTLQAGATMITGETGAGKSIILGAVELALGGRASAQVVKQGKKSAEITLSFALNKSAMRWLQNNELESDEDCLIRRTIQKDGKSRCYINGTPCSVQTVKQLAALLVNIHGQHENQMLMKPAAQANIVDAFAGNQTLLEELKTCYKQWKKSFDEFNTLNGKISESKQRAEFLKFQLDEFEKANLTAEEIKTLPEKHKRLAHSEELLQHYQYAIQLISESEGNNISDQLNQLLEINGKIKQHDSSAFETEELLNSALVQIEEAYENLSHHYSAIDIDPALLATLEQRMSTIHDLSRKHRVSAEELPQFFEKLSEEYNQLENIDGNLEALQQKLKAQEDHYTTLAIELTNSRKKTIKKLNKLITEQIRQLGMPKAEFEIKLIKTEKTQPSLQGYETIEFNVMTNPGNPAQAMTKIASGGELSRISLAIQVITAKHIAIPTLFFDEVDVGIGGTTAAIVGKLLRQLSQSHQVICITHQPQVAASAVHHLHVEKATDGKSTDIAIFALEKNQRIEELARMLGGIEITKQTKSHAKEMLEMHQH